MERAVLSPDYEPVLFELARRMEQNGVLDEAEKYYIQAGRGEPKRARGWVRASLLAERRNDPVQAIQYAEEGTRQESGTAEAFIRSGEIYWKLGAWERSLDSLKEAQKLDPKNPEVWDSLAKTYLERKLFSEAEKSSRTAISLQQDNPELYLRLASALRQMNNLKGAEEAVESALKLHPDLPEALTEKALLLTLASRSPQDLQKAEELFRRAIQAFSGSPEAYTPTFQLGQLLLSTRRYREAEEQFRKAIQFRPGDSAAGFALSRTLHLEGRKKEAEAMLLKFQQESDYKQSTRELNMRLVREPARADLANSLGDLHFKNGDLSSAAIAWERSLKINPDQPSIRLRLEAAQKQLSHDTSTLNTVPPE
jgi:tetratricopeptide (TPR) repeat protein